MVRLAIGICNYNRSPTIIASYITVLFEHPFMREKEYGISALFDNISIPTTLHDASSSCAPVGLLEAPSKNISHHFLRSY